MPAAMLVNQMVVVVGGGSAFGASATTGPDSPGIDDKELAEARELGQIVFPLAQLLAVHAHHFFRIVLSSAAREGPLGRGPRTKVSLPIRICIHSNAPWVVDWASDSRAQAPTYDRGPGGLRHDQPTREIPDVIGDLPVKTL